MDTTDNTAFYRQGDNRVTHSHIQFDGRTFDLATIDSVSLVPPILRREYGYGLIGIGIVLLVVGYFVWGVFLTPMLVGAVLIVVGLALALLVHRRYTVRLNHSDGQVAVLEFTQQMQAEQFVQAFINMPTALCRKLELLEILSTQRSHDRFAATLAQSSPASLSSNLSFPRPPGRQRAPLRGPL